MLDIGIDKSSEKSSLGVMAATINVTETADVQIRSNPIQPEMGHETDSMKIHHSGHVNPIQPKMGHETDSMKIHQPGHVQDKLNSVLLDDIKLGQRGDVISKIRESDSISGLQSTLPQAWHHMCEAEFKFVSGSNFTGQNAVYVSCDLKADDHWSLYDYRKWISANEKLVYQNLPIREGLLFAFEFKCSDKKATLSLPWPVRANKLWYISVFNCTMLDHLAEYNINLDVKDNLKVVEYVDSERQIDSERFFQYMSHFGNVSEQFDCGGLMMEKYVNRNCTKHFRQINSLDVMAERFLAHADMIDITTVTPLADMKMRLTTPVDTTNGTSLSEEQQMIDQIARFGQEHQILKHHCSYDNLGYIDESYSSDVARHHSHFITERFHYPVLQFYNMSHSHIDQLATIYLEWRRYFPRMQYFDVSYNNIKYFSTLADHGLHTDSSGFFDLRHNNITTLTSDDLEALKMRSKTFVVDIRDNPFSCDCKLTHFVIELKNTSNELEAKYEYLRNLKCSSPAQYKGEIISLLENDFCETLVILATPLVILSVFVLVFVVVFFVTIRYRREIMILFFTRLHISLPCRSVVKIEDKAYDAFIAYSENDADWVFKTLLPRLELPKEDDGPGLKLCIHHRDFPIGGSIAENILDKVKVSHHTVLVLSNNFLKSSWCKYEFKTAFAQSLMEKKRHLIMIMKEELDKHLIDPGLKRCLKTFTYVKADDRLFWDKLVYALSDGVRGVRKAYARNIHHRKDDNNKMADDINRNHDVQIHAIDVNHLENNENENIPEDMGILRDGHNVQIDEEMANENNMFDNQGFMQDGIWNI